MMTKSREYSKRIQFFNAFISIWIVFYAMAVSFSQASMSISAGILVVSSVLAIFLIPPFRGSLNQLIRNIEIRHWLIASGFFLFVLFLSLIGTSINPVSYSNVDAVVHFPKDIAKFWYFLIPIFLSVHLISLTQGKQKKILKVWMLFVIALSALGWIEHFFGFPNTRVIPNSLPTKYHVILFMHHHLSIANSFIFPFFILLDQWRLKPEQRIFSSRLFLGMTQIIVLGALFFTYSRILWAALPFGILIWLLLFFRSWKVLVVAIVLGVAGAMLLKDLSFIQRRWHSTTGIKQRKEIWLANWEMFKERPILGVGFKKNHEMSGPKQLELYPEKNGDVFAGHAHSMPLDLLAGSGILGLLAWIIWWIIYFRFGWVLYRNLADWTGGAGWISAGFVFLGNGLTQVNFWEGKVLHQLMWCMGWMLAMVYLRRTKLRN